MRASWRWRGAATFTIVSLLGVVLIGCLPPAPPRTSVRPTATGSSTAPASTLSKSMKGYELYSWQTADGWRFTLITGTNRNKTYDEITSGADSSSGMVKITVTGVEAIKAALSRLPAGESVFWADEGWWARLDGARGTPAQPAPKVVDDLRQYCQSLGIELH